MSDPTEQVRRELVEMINATDNQRQTLEQEHGQVWDTEEMQRDFSVTGFLTPFVVVTRKSDGAQGTLMFCHNPRYYFCFQAK